MGVEGIVEGFCNLYIYIEERFFICVYEILITSDFLNIVFCLNV